MAENTGRPVQQCPLCVPPPPPTCPACGSTRVASAVPSGTQGDQPVVAIAGLQIDFWKLIRSYPKLTLREGLKVCVHCGLAWSSVDVHEARKQIRTYGTEELKALTLDAGDTLPRPTLMPQDEGADLPRPAVAPGEESRRLPLPSRRKQRPKKH
ncbi:MAG: hypothetical protein ACK47B_08825 [Armatimonadota bacterium]